jgi:hypothetical protein
VTAVLAILALFAVASVVTALLQRQRRHGVGIASGSEFLLVGFVLGPLGLDFLTRSLLLSVAPAIALGITLIGVAQGVRIGSRDAWHGAMRQLPIAIVAVAFAAIPMLVFTHDWRGALVCSALVLSSTRGASQLVSLRRIGTVLLLIALVAYDLPERWLPWGLVAALIMGAITAALILGEFQDGFAWLAILGSVAVICGLALRVSLLPLSLALLTGMALGSFSRHRAALTRMLEPTERPALQVLLVLFGASLSWSGIDWRWVAAVVGLRFVALTAAWMLGRRSARAAGAVQLWPAGAVVALVGLELPDPRWRWACAAQLVAGDALWMASAWWRRSGPGAVAMNEAPHVE